MTKKYVDGKLSPASWTAVLHKGVPIPPSRGKVSERVYELASKMEVGDCIEVPYSRTGLTGNLSRALGFEFTQRKAGDKLRIWRTA